MDCSDVERLIDAWLDRELTSEAGGQIEAHLERCPLCRSRHRRLIELLGAAPAVEVPAGLHERVRSAVERIATAPRERTALNQHAAFAWVQRLLRPGRIAAAAACVALVCATIIALHLRGPGRPGPLPPRPANTLAAMPGPELLGAYVRAMILPGQLNPLPVLAEAAAVRQLFRPPILESASRLPRRSDLPPPQPPPGMPELPIVIAGLSALGV